MTERAIADYDGALRLDPSLADIHNTRGELWRKKGDLPKAVADFAAAIKLNPDHVTARANHRALAQELERLGALKAIAGKPSFNCATARRKVEKAINIRSRADDRVFAYVMFRPESVPVRKRIRARARCRKSAAAC